MFSLSKPLLSPNLFFDEVETQVRRKKILDQTPPIMDLVKKNEILLEKGKIVTEKDFLRFQEVSKQFAQRKALSNIFAMLALSEYNLLTMTYLVAITVANLALFLLCYLRRPFVPKPQ